MLESSRYKLRRLHHFGHHGMGGAQELDQGHCSLPKKLLPCALLAVPVVYILLYSSPPSISYTNLASAFQAHSNNPHPPLPVPPPQARPQCNYSDGKWVWDDSVPGGRYDSENCDMKAGSKCVLNGKPDKGYLHWRWQPAGCNLPALNPAEFLRAVRGKHLGFVGDSTARNQAEALVCLLSTFSRAETVHPNEERLGRKFWRLEGKSEDYAMKDETVILDALTEPWTADLDAMDVMVISVGHWFLRPAVYYDDGVMAGVWARPDVNKTDIDGTYFGVYRTVTRRVLEYVNAKSTRDKLVVVATLAPGHADGRYAWNHRDSCSRPKPYEEGEAEVGGVEAEMRKTVLEETAAAAAQRRRWGLRFEVLDVTRLAFMRPDGHPGTYFFEHAYAGQQVPETASNDCLHWCAPGPVDTFNDILMEMVAAIG